MKVDMNHKGLVRGVVIYSQWRAGCVSLERAKDDNDPSVGVAYTPWHRHDEDPSAVEGEMVRLSRFYTGLREVDACSMYFEYRPYSR